MYILSCGSSSGEQDGTLWGPWISMPPFLIAFLGLWISTPTYSSEDTGLEQQPLSQSDSQINSFLICCSLQLPDVSSTEQRTYFESENNHAQASGCMPSNKNTGWIFSHTVILQYAPCFQMVQFYCLCVLEANTVHPQTFFSQTFCKFELVQSPIFHDHCLHQV